MDAGVRSLWDAIACGYRSKPNGGFDFEHNLIVDITNEDVRWLLRIFGAAEDELMERWARFKASLSAAPSSDEALLEAATRWLTEVARSAEALGFPRLAAVCRGGCELTDPDPRYEAGTLREYHDWVGAMQGSTELPRSPGVRELYEAYWGNTHQFELCWYLMEPLTPRAIDAALYLAVAEHGGSCQITNSRVTVSRLEKSKDA